MLNGSDSSYCSISQALQTINVSDNVNVNEIMGLSSFFQMHIRTWLLLDTTRDHWTIQIIVYSDGKCWKFADSHKLNWVVGFLCFTKTNWRTNVIDEIEKSTRAGFTFPRMALSGILGGSFMGLIISAIMGAIMKKEPPMV